MSKINYNNLSAFVASYLGGLKTHSVDINDQEWKYIDGGEGETIVFLHGLASPKVFWRSIMQSYVGQYRVIAVDIPGLCVEKQLNNRKHSFRELSNWLELFLEHLQIEKVHLVGHCVACSIASHFASTRPSRVNTVALLNHLDVVSENADYQNMADIVAHLAKTESLDAWDDVLSSLFFSPPSIPKIMQRYRQRYLLTHRDSLIKLMDEMSEYMPMAMSYLRKLQCPVLTISATHDVLAPIDFHYSLVNQVPWGQHELLENCGHASYIEKGRDVIRIHQTFLRETEHLRPATEPEVSL